VLQYFKQLQQGRGLFITDSLLNADQKTKAHVATWAKDQDSFFRQFNRSMIKMGEVQPLTGGEGRCASTAASPTSTEDTTVLYTDEQHFTVLHCIVWC